MKHDLSKLDYTVGPVAEPYYSRVGQLVALLESLPDEQFDMKTWCAKYGLNIYRSVLNTYSPKNECGTSCCIAGWVSHLAGAGIYSEGEEQWNGQADAPALPRIWLGLNTRQASDLFLNYQANREQAISCLKKYQKTGVLEW